MKLTTAIIICCLSITVIVISVRLISVRLIEVKKNQAETPIVTVTAPVPTPDIEAIIERAVDRAIERKQISRGERGERRTMEVTAYDLSYASCGKHPSHPQYGITASGVHVTEWQTVAMGPSIPFGTKIYIPYFADKPNGGIFIVEDRGGAITDRHIDVYIASNQECMEFGRRELEVWIWQ
jgi:3D (Asp-Asp-Asp) domain-containing protein